jgi:hypothetical protein
VTISWSRTTGNAIIDQTMTAAKCYRPWIQQARLPIER